MNDDQLWRYRADLDLLIDADTYSLECDTGFYARHVVRVRLADVNAPERFTDAGKAAMDFVWSWFREAAGLDADAGNSSGWPLRVRTHYHASRHGLSQDVTFGRFVADVYNLNGESLADALVAAGHAVRVTAAKAAMEGT